MAPDAAAILDEALTAEGFASQAAALRAHGYSAELVEECARRADAAARVDPVGAVQLAKLGLLVAEEGGDSTRIVRCLRSQAQAQTVAGHHGEALAALDRALALTHDARDDQGAAELGVLRVQSLTYLERYEDAEQEAQRVLEGFMRTDDLSGVLRTRLALAELAFRRDRPRAALRHYHAVERALPETAPVSLRAAIAANRANALQVCNRFRAAARWFRRARVLFAELGREHTVAQMDYNLAYSAMLCGRFDEALRCYHDVEPAFERLDDTLHIAHVALDRAEIHLRLSLPHDADVLAERAEDLFARLELRKEQAQAAHFRGRAAEMAEHLEAADEHYRRAEEILAKLGLPHLQLGSLVHRAYVAHRRGDIREARRLAHEAGDLLDADMNPLARASVGLLRAVLELALRRPSRALWAADEVVMECRRIHTPWLHIEAQRLIGQAFSQRGQRDHAIIAYRSAIEQLEQYRGGVPPDEYMAAFLGARSDLYGQIVDLLAARGDGATAFHFAERGKARALVDLLAGREQRANHAVPTPPRLRYLREALGAIYRNLFRASAEGIVPVGRGLPAAGTRAAELEDEMALALRTERQQQLPRGSIDVVDACGLATVQDDLDEDTTLVEYMLADDRLCIFVVTRDTLHVERCPFPADEVATCLERFHFHLTQAARPKPVAPGLTLAATRANLARLRTILFDPIAEHVRTRRVVVVPHGLLHKVPFHALPVDDDEWLAGRFEVRYAPSASVYHHCARPRLYANGAPSVFGLPDKHAPRIREECHKVALRLATRRLFIEGEATFERLQKEARSARILHVATHGMFHRKHPMLSALKLGDGWINLYDLYALDIRGELVVLSTCESGTAAVTDGEEILGLTRGLIFAGAPALLTSQWRVADDATVTFMDAFYEALRRLPDAGAAHAFAMGVVREAHPHPYHWAPFFLTGCPVKQRGRGPQREVRGETEAVPQAEDETVQARERNTP